jgi:hypothetical protein
MWDREFRDYKKDAPNVQQQVEPGRGIVGGQMHELNGWGLSYHRPKPRKKGVLGTLLAHWFRRTDEET